MKISTHLVVQVLLFIASVGTMASGQIPPKYQPYIVGVVSLTQGIVAWINHNFTPSGNPIPPGA